MRDQSVRTGAVAVGEDIGTVQFTVNRFTFSALSKSKFPPAIRCCAVRAFGGEEWEMNCSPRFESAEHDTKEKFCWRPANRSSAAQRTGRKSCSARSRVRKWWTANCAERQRMGKRVLRLGETA